MEINAPRSHWPGRSCGREQRRGRATAELEVERDKVVFRIAVATANRKIVEVVVDAVDGTVRTRGGRIEPAGPVFATRELQLPPPPGR